ncbi:M14 family zinc carboxypeptidase [Tundrisphaera sp. TA3]|uniref:M14 family metallopeptidase n=1 Tax=Tundrisphaera sp. TA3 TaxID=3435775 RepID=UPI003EBC8EE3
MIRRLFLIAGAVIFGMEGPTMGADVPSPEAHLGYRPGADFHLAPWPAVADYFRKVDAASDRVAVRELGKTTEGRPYLVAAVSSEATIRDLDRYQKFQKMLADPASAEPGAGDADAIKASKPVVLITCSIHSSETASTLTAMELLHELASKDDPATREILENAILLLVPSANPDGVDKVASWYERTKGKPWEGEGMPWLYHAYAGHDTNRDWFMLNLQETRLLTNLLYKEWFPTLAYDVHQMGGKGARMFVPPFFDPVNPNLDPRVSQGIFLIGSHMAADLAIAGKKGVLTNAMYDNWWNGGNRTTPQRHNIVAVLTESASVKMATPVFLEKDQLRGATRGFSSHDPAVNFIDPWPGGWWRLRDIVDYQLICARSILTLAGRYREQFQANYIDMGRASIRKGRDEPPYAWVVPADQHDPGTAAKMVEILLASGIKVRRAPADFAVDGASYPAGSWVMPADQPYRAQLKDLMERQVYPNRLGPDGKAEPPYDVAGWTLPLQMGVKAVALGGKVEGLDRFEAVDRAEPPAGSISGAKPAEFYSIRNQSNDDFRVVNALLDSGVEIRALASTGRSGSDELPAGTLVFDAGEKADAALEKALPKASTRVVGRKGFARGSKPDRAIRKARLALYQPWVPSMDEGWTRLTLERFDFAYTTVHDADLRAGKLRDRFDTILLPSTSAKTIRSGYDPDQTEPAYVGGLGAEGSAALRAFVQDGGTLACLENSCAYAIEEFGLPVTNVLKGLSSSAFYAPGSILRCEVDDESQPIVQGMPGEFSAYFDHSLAFDLTDKSRGTVLARYARANPLESGWLLGPEKLQGKAALVSMPVGQGRVVLFGFPPQHRGQPHGTFRLLFNALYLADAPPKS